MARNMLHTRIGIYLMKPAHLSSGHPSFWSIGALVIANDHSHDHNGRYDLQETDMITQTSAVTFRQNLGEMLNQVQYRRDSVVINKDGKPVAALVDARLFERIRRMQGRFDALCQRLEAGFATATESEGMAEIDAAIAEDRREQVRSVAR